MNESFPAKSVPGNEHTFSSNGLVYDVYQLIAKAVELEPTCRPVSEFVEIMNEQCWTDAGGMHITPLEVISAIRESKHNFELACTHHPDLEEHIQKIQHANLDYPILIAGNDEIIDGVHRIARASLDELESINTRTISDVMLHESLLH